MKNLILIFLLSACSVSKKADFLGNNIAEINNKIVDVTNQNLSFSDFSSWKSNFIKRALAKGYNPQDLEKLLAINYQEKIVKQDSNQAENSKMIWDYLDGVLTKDKIAKGRNFYQQIDENKYFLPKEYLIAIWGMESAYGNYTGKNYLPESLATLAYEGRRRDFAENQLLALLDLLNEGSLSWDNLYGSWAGGMGHTQFIPQTFLKFGVDANEDGRRNPFDLEDALASSDFYLKSSKWDNKSAWGEIISLPANFDFSCLNQPLSKEKLQELNIRTLDNQVPKNGGEIYLPAGVNGPAFLLYPNFKVIKIYNNSDSYALAVSLLAEAIRGKNIELNFPRYEKALTKSEAVKLQTELQNLGFDIGKIDGIIGKKTRSAFAIWQKNNNFIPDGFISKNSSKILLETNSNN